jgi:hypothetical protein
MLLILCARGEQIDNLPACLPACLPVALLGTTFEIIENQIK